MDDPQPLPEGTEHEPRDESGLHFHGDQKWRPARWLIHSRIPEVGSGLMAGQSGTLKTFLLLDMVGSVTSGMPWTKAPVRRRGGVLYFAPEGSGSLPMRLAGMIDYKVRPALAQNPDLFAGPAAVNPDRMPIAWATSCPSLVQEKEALKRLRLIAHRARDKFEAEHGLPLVLVVIDTLAAAAGWRDENDNAQAQKAMNVLTQLGLDLGCFVLAADHFGKDSTRGTRGASAKEAAADTVLAAKGERNEETNKVEDCRLVIHKLRDGENGEVFPFAGKPVPMGVDEYGDPVSTLVIDWDVERPAPRPPKTKAKSKTRRVLEEVLANLLAEAGEEISVNGSGRVRAVKRDGLGFRFRKAWMETGAEYGAARKAFSVLMAEMLETGDLREGEHGGQVYVWVASPEGGP